MNYSEMNQVLKSKFGYSIGTKIKLKSDNLKGKIVGIVSTVDRVDGATGEPLDEYLIVEILIDNLTTESLWVAPTEIEEI